MGKSFKRNDTYGRNFASCRKSRKTDVKKKFNRNSNIPPENGKFDIDNLDKSN
jgi:hypothetical protein